MFLFMLLIINFLLAIINGFPAPLKLELEIVNFGLHLGSL